MTKTSSSGRFDRQHRVVSFDGTSIQNANYRAYLQAEDARSREVEPVHLSTGGDPILARTVKQPKPLVLGIDLLVSGNITGAKDELLALFTPGTTGTLIVEWMGTAISSRQLTATVVEVGPWPDGGDSLFQVILSATAAQWAASTQTSTAQNVTSSGQTWAVTNNGQTADLAPVIQIKPTSAKAASNSWTKRRQVLVVNRVDRPFGGGDDRYGHAIDLTNGGWDTAAEVSGGDMQADGDDLRVYLNGRSVPRWFGGGGINSTTTRVFINLELRPALRTQLDSAITAGSPADAGNLDVSIDIQDWPTEGYLYIPSSGECIRYDAISDADADPQQFQSVTRGVRNTTAAAASAGDDVYYVEHEIDIIYGHSGATAPDAASDRQPLLDLTNSDNYKHVWENFADTRYGHRRSMEWSRARIPKDTRAGSVLAPLAREAVAANMTLEYRRDGPVTDKPNWNSWRRRFPAGLSGKPRVRGSTSGSGTSTTTATVTVPTDIEIDDIRCIWIAARAGSLPSITTPTGYTLGNSETSGTMRGNFFWKRVTDPFSEGNVAITIGTSSNVAWVCWTQPGTHKTSPVDVEASQSTASGTSHAAPTSTTTVDRALVICAYAVDASSTWTPPSDFTEIADVQPSAAAPGVMVCYKTQDDAGATGAQTATSTGTGVGIGQTIGMAPLPPVTLTREVDADLALKVLGIDRDGNEVELEALLGSLSSASVNVDPPDEPVYTLDLYGRSQIVNRHPPSARSTDFAVSAPKNQNFTVLGNGRVEKFRVTLKGTGAATTYLSATDNTQMSTSAAVTMTAGYTEHEIDIRSDDLDLRDGTQYAVRVLNMNTPTWRQWANVYEGATTVQDFKIISSELLPEDGAHATDGHKITLDSITVNHDPQGVPYVVLGAEETAYHLSGVLSNDTTSQTLTFDLIMALNDVIEINVGNRTARNSTADLNVMHQIARSDDGGILKIEKGSNTLSWTETGVVATTVTTLFRDKWE